MLQLQRRAAFWDGKPIDCDWDKAAQPWKMFVALARKAPAGMSVTEADVFGEAVVSQSAMPTLCSRLKQNIPTTLAAAIRPGTEPRTYRLNLPRESVFLFE